MGARSHPADDVGGDRTVLSHRWHGLLEMPDQEQFLTDVYSRSLMKAEIDVAI